MFQSEGRAMGNSVTIFLASEGMAQSRTRAEAAALLFPEYNSPPGLRIFIPFQALKTEKVFPSILYEN